MKLEGKVAVVTGAAHGQGANHAKFLAREGAVIIAIDICADISPIYPLGTSQELDETVKACQSEGVEALAIKADVRREDQVREAVAAGIERFGKIDILCNNAGVCKVDAIDEMDSKTLDAIIDVNVKGVFYMTKHVVPGMKARRYGKIINTSSVAGIKALPYASHYAASKGAVVMATKSWANELAEWEINVNSVAPGTILTGMITGLAGQMGDDKDPFEAFEEFNANNLFKGVRGHVTVDDISRMVVYLASEDARMITGQVIAVDAGWTAS